MKPSVRIAIPALNEAQAIGQLLTALAAQNQDGFILEKIVVYSDASTDETDQIVKSFKSTKVLLHRNSKRLGKPGSTNHFFKNSDCDIAIVLDADIVLKGKNFIAQLIAPIIQGNAELTSATTLPLTPQTWIEKVLLFSLNTKTEIYRKHLNGNSIYTCHGRARAFAKKFYKRFNSKAEIVADDAYSYLQCLKLGGRYRLAAKAVLYYRLPQTLQDHLKQSQRFFQGQTQLSNYFDAEMLNTAYQLPLATTLLATFKNMLASPIYGASYILILVIAKLQSLWSPTGSSQWQVATTSKALK